MEIKVAQRRLVLAHHPVKARLLPVIHEVTTFPIAQALNAPETLRIVIIFSIKALPVGEEPVHSTDPLTLKARQLTIADRLAIYCSRLSAPRTISARFPS